MARHASTDAARGKDAQAGTAAAKGAGAGAGAEVDPGYAQGEFGVKPGKTPTEPATPVERAASKPGAAPQAAPLPETPKGGDPGVNPRPGSGG